MAMKLIWDTVRLCMYGAWADHQQHGVLKFVFQAVLFAIFLFGCRRLFRLMKISQQTRIAEAAAETLEPASLRPDAHHESESERRLEEDRAEARASSR